MPPLFQRPSPARLEGHGLIERDGRAWLTSNVSPGSRRLRSLVSTGRSVFAPLAVSRKTLAAPAVVNSDPGRPKSGLQSTRGRIHKRSFQRSYFEHNLWTLQSRIRRAKSKSANLAMQIVHSLRNGRPALAAQDFESVPGPQAHSTAQRQAARYALHSPRRRLRSSDAI